MFDFFYIVAKVTDKKTGRPKGVAAIIVNEGTGRPELHLKRDLRVCVPTLLSCVVRR